MTEQVVLVDAGDFCAGVVIERGICIAAAPILKWTIGKTESYLRLYFKRQGWKAVVPRVKLC